MGEDRLGDLMERAETLCRRRGARLTAQRRRVLELICASRRPLGAYELLDRMADAGQKPAPPTVYRALEFLLAQGLVHKLETIHAFVGCRHPDHPHRSQFLICSSCGQVNEIEDDTISRGVDSAGQTAGFVMERPVVELLGTCARCRPGSDGRETLRPSDVAAG